MKFCHRDSAWFVYPGDCAFLGVSRFGLAMFLVRAVSLMVSAVELIIRLISPNIKVSPDLSATAAVNLMFG